MHSYPVETASQDQPPSLYAQTQKPVIIVGSNLNICIIHFQPIFFKLPIWKKSNLPENGWMDLAQEEKLPKAIQPELELSRNK